MGAVVVGSGLLVGRLAEMEALRVNRDVRVALLAGAEVPLLIGPEVVLQDALPSAMVNRLPVSG